MNEIDAERRTDIYAPPQTHTLYKPEPEEDDGRVRFVQIACCATYGHFSLYALDRYGRVWQADGDNEGKWVVLTDEIA